MSANPHVAARGSLASRRVGGLERVRGPGHDVRRLARPGRREGDGGGEPGLSRVERVCSDGDCASRPRRPRHRRTLVLLQRLLARRLVHPRSHDHGWRCAAGCAARAAGRPGDSPSFPRTKPRSSIPGTWRACAAAGVTTSRPREHAFLTDARSCRSTSRRRASPNQRQYPARRVPPFAGDRDGRDRADAENWSSSARGSRFA